MHRVNIKSFVEYYYQIEKGQARKQNYKTTHRQLITKIKFVINQFGIFLAITISARTEV